MSDSMKVRGYIVSRSVAFLRKEIGDAETDRVIASLPAKLRTMVDNVSPVEWYPVEIPAKLNEAIVTVMGKGDEDKARDALAALGRFKSFEATNTFMRLLMRVLTPALFAKKIPDLWRRDFSKGVLRVDVEERRVVVHFSEVGDYTHLGAISIGFVGFALEQMGKIIHNVTVKGWSLDNPNSDSFTTEFTFKH